MLVAVDTSVFVAAALAAHKHHARAWHWQRAIELGQIDAMICAHGLAEMYSVLTKLPRGLSPVEAQVVVNGVARQVRVVTPNAETYAAAIERCVSASLKSGAVFDALHMVEAEREGADVLLTFNSDDFTRLAQGERPRIVVPPAPPSLDV